MMRWHLACALLVLIAEAALATPDQPVAGGIARVELPAEFGPGWSVTWDDRPVYWQYDGDTPVALVGIPLGFDDDRLSIVVRNPAGAARARHAAVGPVAYAEQRLTVASKYVAPNAAQLERIRAERSVIDAALRSWSDTPAPSLTWQAPVGGTQSSSFGLRRFFNGEPRRPHSGMDIAAAEGTLVTVPVGGRVVATGDWYFNGRTVIVEHGRGLVTLYCHLSSIAVAAGDTLTAGQTLGAVGKTGRVTGAHLHWGVYLNGTAVNPALLLVAESSGIE